MEKAPIDVCCTAREETHPKPIPYPVLLFIGPQVHKRSDQTTSLGPSILHVVQCTLELEATLKNGGGASSCLVLLYKISISTSFVSVPVLLVRGTLLYCLLVASSKEAYLAFQFST